MNNASLSPFSVADTAPELAQRFALIMAGLGALVARRFLRMPHLMRFTLLLYGRLSRAVRRLERALTRPGQMRAAQKRANRTDAARAPQLCLPSGRGWILRELGWEAASFMAQLEALLAEVGARAALAQAPGAGRILRPICRMLGVSPAAISDVSLPPPPRGAGAPVTDQPVSSGATDDVAPRPGRIFSAA